MVESTTTNDHQIQAERSYILKDLILELGGLAHDFMETPELDGVVDSMLSKGFPSNPSTDLQRWIHTHRKIETFKIFQILGAHVEKVSSLVPECFGKFHDAKAVECRACLDRTLCSIKTRSKQSSDGDHPGLINIKLSYQLKATTPETIFEMLSRKTGQMSRTLAIGNKVIVTVINDKLRILSVDAHNRLLSQEKIVMGNKGAVKAKAQVETPEEEELVEGQEVEVEETEEGEETEETEEVEAAEEVAAVVKVKKPKKEKAPLNKLQQEFQTALDGQADVAAKQAYSASVLKKLGVKLDTNADVRVAHMQRVMAIKKHLGTAAAPAAAPKKAVAKK